MKFKAGKDRTRAVPTKGRRNRGPACPVCGKPTGPTNRPFCSARCADVDLGRWLGGHYRIATEEAPGEGGAPEEDT